MARQPIKPDEEDKFCPWCGTRNDGKATSCSSCGKQL